MAEPGCTGRAEDPELVTLPRQAPLAQERSLALCIKRTRIVRAFDFVVPACKTGSRSGRRLREVPMKRERVTALHYIVPLENLPSIARH
jgi:hypothetical protein